MPNIALTDTTGLTTNLTLRDDSPLAKAGLTQIISTATSLAGSLNQAVDQTPIQNVVLSANFNDPSMLLEGAATVGVKASGGAQITVRKVADQSLFGNDPFAPTIPIDVGQCWVGFEIDASLAGKVSASADGFGVGIGASTAISLAAWTRTASSASFLDALAEALSAWRASCSAALLRSQPPGTVTASDVGGTLTFSASYELPISVNALATANLPLNRSITVTPSVTVQVAGQIALTGDFQVRSYKLSPTQLVLGVYKKKATTLTASLSAGAQLQANLGKTDLLSTVLGAVFSGPDLEKTGITGEAASDLKPVIQDALDSSLSIAVNIACSASFTHEAAVVYSIDLSTNAAATDDALGAALSGDWTKLDALPNAKSLRNIVRNTREFKHKFNINLLGIYNAVSVADFVQSCTILHDGDGRLVITDRASASRISAATSRFLADPDKLRRALAESFLATVTYTAGDANLSASQMYFLYENQFTGQEMKDAVMLGAALGLIDANEQTAILSAGSVFRHTRVDATAQYDNAAALRLFFSDPASRTPRSRAEFVRVGRQTMRALIDAGDPAGPVRLAVLANDAAWSKMDELGNTAAFNTIPALSALGPTQLGAVETDWVAVAWWADAMEKIAPALAQVIGGTDSPDFMKKRQKLADLLAAVTRNTHAAFVGGWGLAVMFALSGAAAAAMDISADGLTRHYATASSTAAESGR
jgi:hypothetical protein